jgi:hypothetical protein
MPDLRLLSEVKRLGSNRSARKSLKSQRRDEFHGAPGHNDLNYETLFDQQADQLDSLITGDSAANAKH